MGKTVVVSTDGGGGGSTPPAAKHDTRQARRGPYPPVQIKTTSSHPTRCSPGESVLRPGLRLPLFPSPATFLLSKSPALKGHNDSWGVLSGGGDLCMGVSEIKASYQPPMSGPPPHLILEPGCAALASPSSGGIMKVTKDLELINSLICR